MDFGSDPASVDYAKLYKGRTILLRKAYERSNVGENEEFRRFQEEEAWWLKDYALFMAVKQRFEGKPWSEWAEDIRLRWQNALDLITDVSCTLKLNFRSICSLNSGSSG